MRGIHILLLLLAQSWFSFGVEYKVELFNELQGLPAGFVFCTLKDSRGFLWIGTVNGLSRFDGRNIVSYSLNDGLPSLEVDAIWEDRSGDLWINTRGGLCCFDGRKFHEFHVVPKDVTSYIIDACYSRSGKLWFNINGHFFELDKRQVSKLPDRYVRRQKLRSYLPLPNGDEVVVTDSLHTYYINRSGKEKEITRFYDRHTGLFRKGGSVYAFNSLGLFIVDSSGARQLIRLRDSSNMVMKAGIAPNGTAWLSVGNLGIVAHDLNTGSEQWFTDHNSPLGYFSSSLFVDGDEGVWVSNIYGLGKITPTSIRFVEKQEEMQGEKVHMMTACRTQLCTFSSHYFYCRGLNGENGRLQSLAMPNLDSNNIQSVTEDDSGNVLIYHYGGQLVKQQMSTGKQVFARSLQGFGHVNILWSRSRNVLCVPQPYGLAKISPTGKVEQIPCSSRNFFPRQVVEDSRGVLWMNDSKSRIWRCRNDTIVEMTQFIRIPDAPIQSMTVEGSEIWLGTRGRGLYHYTMEQRGDARLAETYTAKTGLPTDFVTSLAIARDGSVWVVTPGGISQLVMDGRKRVAKQRVYLDESTGSFSTALISEDARGNINCITGRGCLSIEPNILHADPVQNVYILQVTSPDGLIGINQSPGGFFHLPESPSLSSRISDLSFSFTAVGLYASSASYLYKLEGADKDWIRTNTGSADYYNLPSGDYVFRVKTIDENWQESAPAVFSFQISAPFWKTWWFRALSILLVIGLIFYVVKRREVVIRRQNETALKFGELRMQALRAQMNPHFIFNTLNSIQSFVLEQDTEAASRYLTKFARLIRLVLDKSTQDTISIEDEIRLLSYYIDLERMRFANSFDYRFEVEAGFDTSRQIPSFLLQPHIENAILHGLQAKEGEGLLLIRLNSLDEENVECIIEDNGIGREAARRRKEGSLHRHQSKGISITAQRVDILQQQKNKEVSLKTEDLYSESGLPSGTRVRMIIPTL